MTVEHFGILTGFAVTIGGWIFTLGRQSQSAAQAVQMLTDIKNELAAIENRLNELETKADKINMLTAKSIKAEEHAANAKVHRDPERDGQLFGQILKRLDDFATEAREHRREIGQRLSRLETAVIGK